MAMAATILSADMTGLQLIEGGEGAVAG